MPELGRPTKVDDQLPLFNFDAYFPGTWTFEWDMPEGPLGPSGQVTGKTVYKVIEAGKFYEADTDATGPGGAFKLHELIAYQKDNKALSRYVTDSRGFSYLQLATIGGDLGGIYNIFYDSTPFTLQRPHDPHQARHAHDVAVQLQDRDHGVGRRRSVQELRQSLVAEGHDRRQMTPPNRWLPVVGGVMMNMALGMFYGMSVFMLPLEKEFGWTRAQTSWVTTIGLALIAVWYVIAGFIQDRRGPRPVAVIGGLLFSLGFFLASYTSSLPMFYLTAGVIAGTGSGFGYVIPTSVGSKWFPDKRGLVIGLMVGGYGAGSGIFGPIALSLIERVGWRSTFQILSLVFLVMTMTGAYLLQNPPAGYAPPGWDPSKAAACPRRRRRARVGDAADADVLGALGRVCLGTTAGTMVISQLVPFARNAGHSQAVAAFALTVGAIGSASGRVLSGWMSDYAGRLNTLRVDAAGVGCVMPLLFLFRENVVLFYALLAPCTTATARSCRSTRRPAPISSARRTSASTTACCCSRGAWRRSSARFSAAASTSRPASIATRFSSPRRCRSPRWHVVFARNPHARAGGPRRVDRLHCGGSSCDGLVTDGRILFAGAFAAGSLTLSRAGRRRIQARAELAEDAGRHVLRAEGRAAAAGRTRSAGGRAPRRGGGGRRRRRQAANTGGPTNQPGISGLAIEQQDHIYVFNRGVKPVMVFDTDGNLILSGADQEINGKTINPSWQHSGGVDWDGNVYVIERDAHRIVKLSPKLDKFLLQLGTTERERERRDASESAVRHRDPAQRQHRSSPTATATTASSCSTRTESSSSRSARAPAARPTRAPGRANGTCRTSWRSTPRRTSTSSTVKAIASRCSTRT